jgi:uncharacterized protein YhbP (UPF0306 family)
MSELPLGKRISEFLAAHHVVTLATGEGGAVHAASLMYAPDGFSLIWMSDPASRHSQELERNPRVAAAIAPDYTEFAAIRGLQIAGTAVRLTSAAEILHGTALMLDRYGFLRALATGPEPLRKAFNRSGFYRLQPETITLIDNTVNFGHKETLAIAKVQRCGR